ncbi:MAG: peptidoglycan DD-metalloendopeptidase family protein [Clostridiales bacterium]|nr:peptidoglycan DD-metalloendopeptidase family protein [Clostridiales bacterium]
MVRHKKQSRNKFSIRTLKLKKKKEEAIQEEKASIKLDQYIDRIFTRFNSALFATGNIARYLISFIGRRTGKSRYLLSDKVQSLSDVLAKIVTITDYGLDNLYNKTISFKNKCIRVWNLLCSWADNNKGPIAIGLTACIVVASVSAMLIGSFTAYEYKYRGKTLGVVKDQQDVYKTVDIIGDKLSMTYGAEIIIDKDKDISFEKVVKWDVKVDSKDDVLNTLTYLSDVNANAYAIYKDDVRVAVLDCKDAAEEILQAIKDTYIKDDESTEYESVGFAEKVRIDEVNTKIGNIQKKEEILEYLLTGSVEKRIHIIESGETFNQIAKDYGLEPSELQASNPDVDPDKLQIGQELVLNQVCPVLTVQTKEITTYVAKIDYDIEYEETSTLYKGEQTVKSRGVAGERKVVAEIVRNNGIEVSRNELSSEIISEPKAQVVLKGTKDPPPLVGTGKFIYPTRGRLSSRFGYRWGRMHNGIDLAAPAGTKIRAADGGVVTFAGWDGALGYCVRIDHGGNRTTVYGHCSKLFVKKGDKVYQDQHIANVGNTGRSTGPHLHFEIRINGVPKNPLNYL